MNPTRKSSDAENPNTVPSSTTGVSGGPPFGIVSQPPRRFVLGLGSNLGDRGETLRGAMEALATTPGLSLLGRSGVLETEPWGRTDQPRFLNAAVLIETSLSPLALLDVTLGIERAFGRVRDVAAPADAAPAASGAEAGTKKGTNSPDQRRWGPRTLDIDLLWSHGCVVDDPRLQVPHPRLHERIFALVPLLELVPDAADPRSGLPYLASLDSLRKG
jgi:2-amino-4-hydroxy-6-hydroxymethyldihydropteridine diphosphokinase